MDPSDRELWERAAAGEHAAFGELFDRHARTDDRARHTRRHCQVEVVTRERELPNRQRRRAELLAAISAPPASYETPTAEPTPKRPAIQPPPRCHELTEAELRAECDGKSSPGWEPVFGIEFEADYPLAVERIRDLPGRAAHGGLEDRSGDRPVGPRS